jgi:hypothetical protein
MSKCTIQVFEDITAAMWQRISQAAADFGLPVKGDSGRASKDGFEVSWTYLPARQRLELQCHDSPFWAPCSLIHKKLDDLVAQCRNL